MRSFLLAEPHPPYINLDQIDFILIGDEGKEIEGLCKMCSYKSAILKTIKRSSANSLRLIHSLLFNRDYPVRNSVQDEFRGLETAAFVQMDIASHFKELSKLKKGEPNYALDILVFIRVRTYLCHVMFLFSS